MSLVRLEQHFPCYLLMCESLCAAVWSTHRAAQASPQSSTLVPGCSSEQVWWWRPRPVWGPAPLRRCWETARTHGSGTLWSSASNGSWEEWELWLDVERERERGRWHYASVLFKRNWSVRCLKIWGRRLVARCTDYKASWGKLWFVILTNKQLYECCTICMKRGF